MSDREWTRRTVRVATLVATLALAMPAVAVADNHWSPGDGNEWRGCRDSVTIESSCIQDNKDW